MHIYPSSPNSSSPPPSFPSEEIAAIKIQSGFRGYRVRKQLQHPHSAANRPTRPTNSLLTRHTPQQQRKRNMNSPSNGATKCNGTKANHHSSASSNTGADARRESNGSATNPATIEDRCATKIQAGVRGFLVRKKQKIATDAATKIQAGYRGFKARKEVQKIKQM